MTNLKEFSHFQNFWDHKIIKSSRNYRYNYFNGTEAVRNH